MLVGPQRTLMYFKNTLAHELVANCFPPLISTICALTSQVCIYVGTIPTHKLCIYCLCFLPIPS
jgi:hypothetical protein